MNMVLQLTQRPSRLIRLAIATLLGGASAFSFAPHSLWPLMLLAICGVVWLLDTARSPREAAGLGWFFGFAHFVVGLSWISTSFQFQSGMPQWLGFVAVAALAAYLAAYPALALWLSSRCWSDSPTRVLVLASAWTAAEWVRGHLFTGFPWNMAAQIWSDTPVMLQSARLVGAYGLTLLTVALFASAALLVQWTGPARHMLIAALLCASALVVDGWWRLERAPPNWDRGLPVHLVQANVRQDLEADPERQPQILERYESMTRAALLEGGPGVVIWPETALEHDIERDAAGRLRLGDAIGPEGLLILGAVGHRFDAAGAWLGARNSLLAIDSAGALRAVYDKRILVPFGEYLPASEILSRIGLSSVAQGHARFLAGTEPATLAPGIPPFAPAICYEIIFPSAVVAPGPRPQWILNISNDAWFGETWGPYQHFAQARLRAVEEGLPVVRSTPTGVSGVIDAYGRAGPRTILGQQAVLSTVVPEAAEETAYSQAGDWTFLTLLLAFVLAALAGAKTRPKQNLRHP